MSYYKADTVQNTKSNTESNVQNHSLMSLVLFLFQHHGFYF